MPCRAFYEGVNPKTILNNCQQLDFNDINCASTAIDDAIGMFVSQRVPCANCRKALWHLHIILESTLQ